MGSKATTRSAPSGHISHGPRPDPPDSRDSSGRPPPRRPADRLRPVSGRRPVGHPVAESDIDQPVAGPGPEGREYLPPGRVETPGDPDDVAPRGGHPEIHGFDGGGGTVIERGVGHLHAGQPGDESLEFEDGLEDPLGHFRLVRRVGGDEFRTRGQSPGDGRHLVVVGPATGETDQVPSRRPVGPGQVVEIGEGVGFGDPVGEIEPTG